MTHTLALMELSDDAYNEILGALQSADYSHCILEDGTLDMSGIGVQPVATQVDRLVEVYARATNDMPGGGKLRELAKTPRIDTNAENAAYLSGWRDCVRTVAVKFECYTDFVQQIEEV